jgi:hypothetical protein
MVDLPELPADLDVGALPPPAEAPAGSGSAWLSLAQALRLDQPLRAKTGKPREERFCGHPLALEQGDAIELAVDVDGDRAALCAAFGPWREGVGYGPPIDWQVFSGQLELRFTAPNAGLYLMVVGSPWKKTKRLGYALTARCVDVGCGPLVPRYGPAETRGRVHRLLREASGLAASPGQPGVLWSHNDAGDRARLFALDDRGQLLGCYGLAGVEARDIEDIAIGPGPDGEYHLYVGDIGDNDQRRERVVVLRLAEPSIPGFGALVGDATPGRGHDDPEGERRVLSGHVERFELRYPDRPRDAETLCVDPRSGDVYIVTKAPKGKRSAHVFRARAPLRSGVLEHVCRLRLGSGTLSGVSHTRVTGGDIAPSGEELVLRTRDDALLWRKPPGTSWGRALALAPWQLTLDGHDQGEAIAFSGADGRSLYTLGEGREEPLRLLPREA